MEHIAKELGVTTPELMLPVRKLLADRKIRVEGQKRATQYYPPKVVARAQQTAMARAEAVAR